MVFHQILGMVCSLSLVKIQVTLILCSIHENGIMRDSTTQREVTVVLSGVCY